MSLKAELETWAAALKAYDEEDFEKSLQFFSNIADSSKILTNMGLIYATLGEHEIAVEQFQSAIQLDQYLAIAYFQCGVSNFLLNRFDQAIRDFDDALLYLRGNQDINYDQIGLKFQLWSAEILFNRGLSRIYLGNVAEGLADMQEARREKVTEEHNVIDDAIADQGEGYTVFSIPVGVLYRPSESKLKNAKTKDYLGKAKLVAAADESDAFTEFTGVARMKQQNAAIGALGRATTLATAPRGRDDDGDKPTPLQRANTTINVSTADRTRSPTANAPERARSPANGGTPAPPPAPSASLARSMTSNGRPGLAGPGGAPTRGLSIRKPGPPGLTSIDGLASAAAPSATSPYSADRDKQMASARGTQFTDFYDDYVASYGSGPGSAVPPVPSMEQRAPRSQQSPNPSAGASSAGSMRRRPTRRGTVRARPTTDYEEEEGYGSGDEPTEDVMKIRVKLHYQDDVRGMTFWSDMAWSQFLARVTGKFSRQLDGLGMQFRDEDGEKVSLRDEMDYELAIETARETAKTSNKAEGRLEIWCVDE